MPIEIMTHPLINFKYLTPGMMHMKIGVIIPAAGASSRYGSRDKLAEDLGGRPLLLRTVEFFTKREDVTEIIVAGPKEQSLMIFKIDLVLHLSFHGVTIVKGWFKSLPNCF